ncbi:ATP-dependent helicase, partial [Pseudomonas aeruginosa]
VLQAANEQGATSLSFAGEVIDISDAPAVQQELARARQNMTDVSDSEPHSEEGVLPGEDKEKVGVILKDADEINSALLRKAAAATPLVVPDWSAYAREPFPHQREGIEWMLKLMGAALQDETDDLYRLQGGLLADDMGLGKTYM